MTSRVAIGIATVGRAEILAQTLAELVCQTRPADRIVVCCTTVEDVGDAPARHPHVEVVYSAAGLPRQRNRLLDATTDCNILLFFDDDFVPDADYVAAIEDLFDRHPDAVVATGHVIADGICGRGLTVAEGRKLILADRSQPTPPAIGPVFNGYGCNFAVRADIARRHKVRFDERLPLYAWQEDVDFSRRMAAHGLVLRTSAARGVHLGVKQARTPGLRLGYAQVANPIYVARKRAGYPMLHALKHIARNLGANLLRSARPEPWVDRRGRLRGNMIAFGDLMLGRLAPERMLLAGNSMPKPSAGAALGAAAPVLYDPPAGAAEHSSERF